ncbi:hypothetical protein LEP3755_63880 (plasmid) [Leptolyngbya sp. NIES-3755]|nr:hypothetical protein LEP3755_63880 [Leptolyngbya sp. NIES-3755]
MVTVTWLDAYQVCRPFKFSALFAVVCLTPGLATANNIPSSSELQEDITTTTVKPISSLNYSRKANDLLLGKPTLTVSPIQYDLLKSRSENLAPEIIGQQPEQPESPPIDKSQYNLLNPTPRRLWRSFNPSRPSKTDTPFTVDAGAFQIESDLVTYTRGCYALLLNWRHE